MLLAEKLALEEFLNVPVAPVLKRSLVFTTEAVFLLAAWKGRIKESPGTSSTEAGRGELAKIHKPHTAMAITTTAANSFRPHRDPW